MNDVIFFLCSLHFASVQKNIKKRNSLNNKQTLIIAHRGLTSRHLENSLPAIEAAFDQGVDGVEFDVQLTKDLVPVVTHDRSLSRLCGVGKNVDSLDFLSLSKLNQHSERYQQSYKIAQLGEILEIIPRGRFVNIEIKETAQVMGKEGIKKILKVIKPHKSRLKIVVSSFIPSILEGINQIDGEYSLAFLLDRHKIACKYLGAKKILGKIDYLNPHISLVNQFNASRIKALGVQLIFWGHKEKGEESNVFESGHFALISDISEELIHDRFRK